MKIRLTARITVSFALAAACLAGTNAPCASTPAQTKFLAGEAVAPPDAKAANARVIHAARELQAGPQPGESPELYGRRAQGIGLALGLTNPEAIRAGEVYRNRAMWTGALKGSGGFGGPGVNRQALAASGQRARAVMANPNWSAPTAVGQIPYRTGARPAPSAAAAFKRTPAVPPMLRRREVPPPVKPVASEDGFFTKLRSIPGFLKKPAAERSRISYDRSAALFARAGAITEANSGDGVGAWFRRKGLQARGTLYALSGLLDDGPGMKKTVDAAGASIASGMFPEQGLKRALPGKASAYLIDTLSQHVPPKWRLLLGVSAVGAKTLSADAVASYRAVTKTSERASFWNAADAVMSVGVLGLDVAGMVSPAGALRNGVRGAVRTGPRAFLRKDGVRPELAAELEASYLRIEDINGQYRRRKIAGAPKEELDGLLAESASLSERNTRLQTEIPALRDYFKDAKPGDPASPEFMEVLAANMGVKVETVSGVRMGGYSSLKRDMGAGGIMPNPGKALDDGTITGSAAHLLRDGSPHLVSVADRLKGGLVLLMTGYADANRATKTMAGVMYEFEGVQHAARVPLSREVFRDAMSQGELMVPKVPLENIKYVRSWRAEINPANDRQLIYRSTDRVALDPTLDADAILEMLKNMPHRETMRIGIP